MADTREEENEDEKAARYKEMAKEMMAIFSESEKAGIKYHGGLPMLSFQKYVELRDTEKIEKEAVKAAREHGK